MKKALIIFLSLLAACGQLKKEGAESASQIKILSGHWLFNFDLGEEVLPFNAFFSDKDDRNLMVFKNADEVITTEDVSFSNDSLFISLPIFGTRIEGKILSDSSINGFWYNTTKNDDYKIPFTASFGIEDRFIRDENNYEDFSGKWEVIFSPESEKPCKAIGLFNQNGDVVTGTFLTETGDYRYLEGVANRKELKLSCFDGAHAFLFKAEKVEGGLEGHFWSGNHWEEPWRAKRNEGFQLSHPDSITYVVDPEKEINFSFRNLNNEMVSLSDPQFEGKAIIIQIMGTWCPNCADESKDFAKLHEMYGAQGLEIIAVSYERSDDFEIAREKIEKFKNEVGANYTFLFAGKVEKNSALNDFNMLNSFSSYPTSIFLDRNKKIRKVHTGYYGPGTGEYYFKYKEETEMLVEKMLAEKVSS